MHVLERTCSLDVLASSIIWQGLHRQYEPGAVSNVQIFQCKTCFGDVFSSSLPASSQMTLDFGCSYTLFEMVISYGYPLFFCETDLYPVKGLLIAHSAGQALYSEPSIWLAKTKQLCDICLAVRVAITRRSSAAQLLDQNWQSDQSSSQLDNFRWHLVRSEMALRS